MSGYDNTLLPLNWRPDCENDPNPQSGWNRWNTPLPLVESHAIPIIVQAPGQYRSRHNVDEGTNLQIDLAN